MIFVTGATGTIGSSTVKALKARGARFKVGARSPDKLEGQAVETVPFDWDKPETFEPALQGVEKLFLLTPNTTDQQAQYTQALVGAAKKTGVKHIVRLSVMGAEAEPGILLGRMHRASEKAIQGSGIAWTMLRPTFFMDNFLNYYGVEMPEEAARKAMQDTQTPAWMVDGFLELAMLIRNGRVATPASGVQDALGRPPRSFKEYAKDYAAGNR